MLSEFGGGPFGLAAKGIGSGEVAAKNRYTRHGAARFFEPDDRLADVRLQRMHGSDQVVAMANAGIARAETNGLLHERRHLLYRAGVELALGETV